MSKQLQELPLPPLPQSAAVSATMRGNRSRNTRPELAVRRFLFGLGYRYRLHRSDIPGCPDIAFLSRRKVVFVHGCFWHQHLSEKCPLQSHPKSNLYYWRAKLKRNQHRDTAITEKLRAMKWKVLIIWECETQDDLRFTVRLRNFLGQPRLSMRHHRTTRRSVNS